MKYTGEDHLDLAGPLLRGPFSTADLVAKLGKEEANEYISKMQAEHKMFWMGNSKTSYYAYKELPIAETGNPMENMAFRYGGDFYWIGPLTVYDEWPYPVRDNAEQQTYVHKSRRAAFDGAVRLAFHKTPYGSDLPRSIYLKEEQAEVEFDHLGKPMSYGKSVYISSADAASMLVGERVSDGLIARLHAAFPHASFLTNGAPYIAINRYGIISVYSSVSEIAAKGGPTEVRLDRESGRLSIVPTDSDGLGIEIEIVAGWKRSALQHAASVAGSNADPSLYDSLTQSALHSTSS